ncbi:type III secretion system chaperone [Marinibactrum halimedae]|uniref:Molecular chaperone Tir n=1 Tax=Marinibactrum halimedae TaxID=1444977 RepID=A0AA37WKX7_9GAMM|nr:type III secretion system chaperone [Marinibactrum halimedae]MCD9459079.1 type III secretion system chaperone [Marinibactrum halimedae]GLS24680.1 hypothetical protein GCM10007877_03940 [Marinibactrum halimedae]
MGLDFQRLIQELAVNLKQPLMDPIEDACRISWDGIDLFVYAHVEGEKGLIILTLEFGELSSEPNVSFLEKMLSGNYLWAMSEYATLSIHPESKKLTLCDRLFAEKVNADMLTKRVGQLYHAALYWKGAAEEENNQYSSHNDLNYASGRYEFLTKV